MTGAIAVGMFFPVTLGVSLLAPLVKGNFRFKWMLGHTLLLFSVACVFIVVAFRGFGAPSFLLQQLFLCVMPFVTLLYAPTEKTVRKFELLIYVVFALDFAFNAYGLAIGSDILGRILDVREGLSGGRLGGLFASSFYSGTISILAMIFFICGTRFRWLIIVAACNLLMAGSLRLVIPLVLIPFFFWRWKKRNVRTELIQIFLLSIFAVFATFATSSFGDMGFPVNDANDIRIFAWGNAIQQILGSPIGGVGYPGNSVLDGVDIYSIKESLVAESWYLNSAITFGIPFMLFRFFGMMAIFYGSRYKKRTSYEAVMVPIILVDLVYGGAFEGLLFYATFWIVIHHQHIPMPTNTRVVMKYRKTAV